MARKKSAQKKDGQPSDLPWVDLDLVAPYADLLRINTSERGMMLTFGQIQPDAEQVRAVGRVVLPPKTAGEFLMVLAKQVAWYEEHHGKITPESLSFTLGVKDEEK